MAASLVTGTLKAAWDPAVAKLAPGVFGEIARAYSAADVEAFARLSGDDNPMHVDEAYAAATPFGGRIVHGVLFASLIPTIFGATIRGSIYMSQTLRFRRPVRLGDTVVARVEVTAVRDVPAKAARGAPPPPPGTRQQVVTCATTVRRVASPHGGSSGGGVAPLDELVLDGEAQVLLPPPTTATAQQELC